MKIRTYLLMHIVAFCSAGYSNFKNQGANFPGNGPGRGRGPFQGDRNVRFPASSEHRQAFRVVRDHSDSPAGSRGGYHNENHNNGNFNGNGVKVFKIIHENQSGPSGPATNFGPPPSPSPASSSSQTVKIMKVIHTDGSSESGENNLSSQSAQKIIKVIHQDNAEQSDKSSRIQYLQDRRGHSPEEAKIYDALRNGNRNSGYSDIERKILEIIRGRSSGKRSKLNDEKIIEIIREGSSRSSNSFESKLLNLIRQAGITQGRKAKGLNGGPPTAEEEKILQIVREIITGKGNGGRKIKVISDDDDFGRDFTSSNEDFDSYQSNERDYNDRDSLSKTVKIIHENKDTGRQETIKLVQENNSRNRDGQYVQRDNQPPSSPSAPSAPLASSAPDTSLYPVIQQKTVQVIKRPSPPPIKEIFRTVRVFHGNREKLGDPQASSFINGFGRQPPMDLIGQQQLPGHGSIKVFEHDGISNGEQGLKLLKVFNH